MQPPNLGFTVDLGLNRKGSGGWLLEPKERQLSEGFSLSWSATAEDTRCCLWTECGVVFSLPNKLRGGLGTAQQS